MDTKAFVAAFITALNQSNPDVDVAVKMKMGDGEYESKGSITTVDALVENYVTAHKKQLRTTRNNLVVYNTKTKTICTAPQYAHDIGMSYSTCYTQHLKPSVALPFIMKKYTLEEIRGLPYLNGSPAFYNGCSTWADMCKKCYDSEHNHITILVYVV